MKITHLILVVLFSSLIIFQSCKKDDKEAPNEPSLMLLPCDYFSTNRTLVDDPDKAVDYVINCVMDVNANITIEPGVVIHFKENAGIVVRSGFFRSLGTADKPVILKGEMNLPGFWSGIYYQNSSQLNELRHTQLLNAGGQAFDSNNDRGAVILFTPARVTIDSCRIERSGHFGFNAPYANCQFEVTNTIFANNTRAPFNIEPEYLGSIDPSNIFGNSAENFIAVQLNGNPITSNQVIKGLPIPYRIYQLSGFFNWLGIIGGDITNQGAVTFQFNDGLGIYIESPARFNMQGTADANVVFTATNASPGSWKGFYFGETQQDNRLTHVTIENAGNLYDGNRAAIFMWNSPRLTVQNSTIRNTNGCALFDYNGPDNPNPNLTLTNNSFINNTGGEVCFP